MRMLSVIPDHFMTILAYPTQHDLMFALARFQEFYENATLRGRHFTRQELLEQQPNYYSSWNGCNFPLSVVEAVAQWPDLDAAERIVVLEATAANPAGHPLKAVPAKYIVGVHGQHPDVAGVIRHERAHALWAARPDYQEGITDMLEHHYTQLVRDQMRLKLEHLGYHPSVWLDEIQAYHQHGWDKVFGDVAPMCPEFALAQSSFIAQIYREVRSVPVTLEGAWPR